MKYLISLIVIAGIAIAGVTIYSQKQNTSIETDTSMVKHDEKMMEKEPEPQRILDYSNTEDTSFVFEIKEDSTDDVMEKNDDPNHMQKDEESSNYMEKDDVMENNTNTTSQEVMVKTPGSFVDYNSTNISSLTGNIVLDFSASWCPSCRSFKKDVENSLSDIPSDLTIVLVDYDNNKDLRKKYGVTRQHTFVQIDNTGTKINQWSGGNTLESLFSHIK